jgi:quercetin dioxygenase-like cupin family protein
MLVRSEEVGGRYMLSEHVISPGSGPPLHSHEQEEILSIVEGAATFVLGSETIEAVAGDVISVPAGMAHTWANLTDEPLRMRVMFMPGGLEDFLFNVAGLSNAEIEALAAKFGVRVLGPPIR